jgi:hypothetical protein
MVGHPWGKIALPVTLVIAALLALAPAASASGEPDTGAFNAFTLKVSRGYKLLVLAGSQKGYRHGEIVILATRKHEAVGYVAPATVTDTRVAADLDALGSIDVTFQPSGEVGVAHPICDRSQRVTYEKGSYIGLIDIRGEEGYMRARADSVPYSPHPSIDFICGVFAGGEVSGRGLPGARFRARSKAEGGKAVELKVNQNRPGGGVKIQVSARERRGRVRISREMSLDYSARAFDFASDLGTASLHPPVPFSGTGRYRREAQRANRWTGNLEVDLPGRSDVPLTGSGFDAGLVHARLIPGGSSLGRRSRSNLLPWPLTKPSPTAFATPSLLALR